MQDLDTKLDLNTIVFNTRMSTCSNIISYLNTDKPSFRAHFYSVAAQDPSVHCVAEACWLPQCRPLN